MGKQLAVTVNAVHRVGSKMYLTADGVHHKVKKAYLTDDGMYKLCYEEGGPIDIATMSISYTGNMIDAGVVAMTDGQYRLLTLTSSGTLTVDASVSAEVWMCGGGAKGSGAGHGGGGAFTATGVLILSGVMLAVVASAQGGSSFGGIQTKTTSGCGGGTGAGASARGGNLAGGVCPGDGISKYPFLDSTYFQHSHCGGGAGGGTYVTADVAGTLMCFQGGDGGTNGGDGTPCKRVSSMYCSGGSGGRYGGGNGGYAQYLHTTGYVIAGDGSAASYYGSGGGGGGDAEQAGYFHPGQGGAGYQGVIYIRIPVNQTTTSSGGASVGW